MIEGVSLQHIMVVAGFMFFIGMYGFLTRKNMITMLMSLELMLNAVNINFASINAYMHTELLQGHFFALFVIAVAAAEAALAIAIIVLLYRKFNSINIEKSNTLKY